MAAKTELASVSIVGDREVNEDYCASFARGRAATLIVCDGMGGSERGDIASRGFGEAVLARAQVLLLGKYSTRDDARIMLTRAFELGAQGLREAVAANSPGADSKTTAVVAVALPTVIAVGHLGDSRACLVTEQGLAWRTRDHSLVQMLVEEGEVAEADMGTHPDQGKLFKFIDADRDDPPSVQVYDPLHQGQVLLLCSDGFWEYTPPRDMAQLCRTDNLQGTLTALADTACERAAGRSDNVTAVALRMPPRGLLERTLGVVTGLLGRGERH